MRLSTIVVAALLLAGCGKGETTANPHADAVAVAHGFTPPAAQRATPIAGQAQTTPLRSYIGHYPNDPVDGVEFYDRTDVALALNDAVIDPAVRRTVRGEKGPQTPIFAQGTRIAAWGCEAHDCADHHWTFLVDPRSGKGELCYHDAAAAVPTRWYAGAAPETRAAACPSGDQPPTGGAPGEAGDHA